MSARRTLGLGLWLLASSVAHADALSDLVDRYVAWRGGAAFERLESFHARGALIASGLHGTQEIWAQRDGSVRLEADLGVIRQTQVVTSAHSWELTPSGQLQTLAQSDGQALQRDAALQFADVLHGRGGAHTELEAPESRDGRTWRVLRVSFGDADSYEAFIDPATGALEGFRILEDRQRRFEKLSDWRVIAGVRMPFLQTVTTEAADGTQAFALTSLELNVPLTPAALQRPAPVRRTSFAGGALSTGWIPFQFYGTGHIFFDALVNGHRTRVLLDSGATVSAIDTVFMRTLGVNAQGKFAAPGSGGIATAGFAGGLTVEVGNLTVHNLKAITLDLAPTAARMTHALPFVLGDEVFNELAVDIDFVHRRLAFRDPGALGRPAGSSEVPLRRIFGNRSVPVALEGAAAVEFEFDLGNGSLLQVYPAYYQAHRLLDGRPTSQLLGGAVGGFHPWTVATLRTVNFAGVEFHEVPADFAPDTLSGANSNRVVGNIGNSILARFHLIIDYSHDRLYAIPYPDTTTAAFARDRLGLASTRLGQYLRIDFVAPGSPAQAAGLKAGEKITRINGRAVSAWSAAALLALRYQPAGTRLRLTVAGGPTRRLQLADYF